MILPTACINWAALRSGLSLPDFMASLDPEREVEILKSYNAWRKSKGLPEVRPCVPKPPVAPKPTTLPKPTTPPKPSAYEPGLSRAIAEGQMPTQGEDKREPQDDDADEPQDDDISSLVSKIADQVAREELEDAELIRETLRMPEERIPRELEEELEILVEEADTEQAAASQVATEPQVEANTSPSEVAAAAPSEVPATAPQESPATAPSEVPAAEQDSSASAPHVEPDGPNMEADILSIARTLPKVADPALYQEILAQLDAPAEVVKSLAEETRKLYTAKHRSTVGLRAFIEWLSNNHHPL